MRNYILGLIATLFLSSNLMAAEAVIEAPEKVKIGDLVVLDATKSKGDNHTWIVDEKAQGRTISFGRHLVFAIGTPGKYTFILILADTDANIDYARHTVTVGSGDISDPKPDPPTDPEPDPPTPSNVYEVSKAGAQRLNDPQTARALYDSLANLVRGPPASTEELRIKVQDAVAQVLLNRPRESQQKDWLREWRIPVSEELGKNPERYLEGLREAAQGLADTLQITASPQEKTRVVAYGRDDCPPCLKWSKEEEPKFVGVDVVKAAAANTAMVPFFDIHVGSKVHRHVGYLTYEQFNKYLQP